MLRKVVILTVCFVAAAVVYSCRGEKAVDFAAAHQAKAYYDLLLKEKYADFVEGMDFPEPIPDSYRQQLVDNARMFVGKQQEEHHGIREVRVVNCVNDSVKPAANAFLMLCYGDSTIEEVVVPMVKRDGRWLMK
jgi:hypothetical protein